MTASNQTYLNEQVIQSLWLKARPRLLAHHASQVTKEWFSEDIAALDRAILGARANDLFNPEGESK